MMGVMDFHVDNRLVFLLFLGGGGGGGGGDKLHMP